MKKYSFKEIDLSDLNDVRNGCNEILKELKKPINSIICNAAVYKPRLRKPDRSVQGFENLWQLIILVIFFLKIFFWKIFYLQRKKFFEGQNY